MDELADDKLKNRIIELDIARGIAVLLMVLDHLVSDFSDIMPFLFTDFPRVGFWLNAVNLALKYWEWDVRLFFHYIICFVFFALTGICTSFSKRNCLRGLKLFLVAIVISVATYIFGTYILHDINILITFGVLHCISLSLIVAGILLKFIKNKWFYLICGLAMLAIGLYIELVVCQPVSYVGNNIIITTLKAIVGVNRCGSDCFPFFLNGSQIFVGIFLGKQFYSQKTSIFKKEYKNNALTFIGRNSLVVYVCHQIILPILLAVFLVICGFHIDVNMFKA